MSKFSVIIPARYGSTRLAAKALLKIQGLPMIMHVYQRACESGAESVHIATDDQRIIDVANRFGASSYMTSSKHLSGTDRVAEVAKILKIDDDHIIVNLQGDEPLMPPKLIHQVAESLAQHPDAQVSTACHKITNNADIFSPNAVKVIRDKNNYALYFSRAPLPWSRDGFYLDDFEHWQCRGDINTPYYRHIGLYAYRNSALQQISASAACDLEKSEFLEQLRVLYQGGRIYVLTAKQAPEAGVDTAADLARVRQIIANKSASRIN